MNMDFAIIVNVFCCYLKGFHFGFSCHTLVPSFGELPSVLLKLVCLLFQYKFQSRRYSTHTSDVYLQGGPYKKKLNTSKYAYTQRTLAWNQTVLTAIFERHFKQITV